MNGLFLVKNGVPWEAVFGPIKGPLSPTLRFACVVAFGEMDGGVWNWERRQWEKPKR